MNKKNTQGIDPSSLPFYIPIADQFLFNTDVQLDSKVIGIQFRDLIRKKGREIRPNPLLEVLFSNREVILFSSGRDDLIEPTWFWRDEAQLFHKLGEMGFMAATGINFSVNEDMCPTGQHLNIKKSLKSSSLAEENGLPSIPHLYAVNENERRQNTQWLNAYHKVRLISINCQRQKGEHDLNVLKKTIRYYLENTDHEIHIILKGFRISWLEGLYEYLPYLHIAQKQPFMHALNFTLTTFDRVSESLKNKQVKMDRKDRHLLATLNFEARRDFLAYLHEKHKHSFKKLPLRIPSGSVNFVNIRQSIPS